eukprot:TRINITY_DN2309_c0_g1_i3.p1 TRINITY_DN2309_c0_g1~~TRINITY_DN2309_c0_g1_i3.p1  ORF type:complete len:318 (-),score=79.86 TRINITY_DN2309_c0_g1_i3:66-1019(-)
MTEDRKPVAAIAAAVAESSAKPIATFSPKLSTLRRHSISGCSSPEPQRKGLLLALPSGSPTSITDGRRKSLPPLDSATRARMAELPSPSLPRLAPRRSNSDEDGSERRPSLAAALHGTPVSPLLRRLRTYHSKYDPKEVIILRDFYLALLDDARLSRRFATASVVEEHRLDELKRDVNRNLAVKIFNGMSGVSGTNAADLQFRQLLDIIYPNATKRDVESMMTLAFPDGEPRLVSPSSDAGPLERFTTSLCTAEDVLRLEREFDDADTEGYGWLPMLRVREALAASGLEPDDDTIVSDLFDPGAEGRVIKSNYVTVR